MTKANTKTTKTAQLLARLDTLSPQELKARAFRLSLP